MIGVFLPDDVVTALEVVHGDAPPPGFIEIFPEAKCRMIAEGLDNGAEFGFGGGIARGKFGEFAKIDPAIHAMLISPIEGGLLIGDDLAVPIGGLRHAEKERTGV